jgi:hypothetical protein
MSVGNLGAAKNLLDGLSSMSAVAGGGLITPANFNQGSAQWADAVRDVLARADLPANLNANARMFVGSASTFVTIASAASRLVGVLLDSTNGSDLFVQFYNNASPTVGTTGEILDLSIPANSQRSYVFEEPIPFATALTFAVSTAAHGATQTGGGNVKVVACWIA